MKLKFLLPLLIMAGTSIAQRPTDPWVIRGVMPDNRIRMIILNLANDLVAAYDGTNCGLYMMMNQIMDDVNDTYRHGGGSINCTWIQNSPTGQCHASHMPKGTQMYKNTDEQVWIVKQGSNTLDVKPRYEGYYLFGDSVILIYHIKLSDTQTVIIKETPDDGGGNSIVRQFDISGIPDGYSLNLDLGGSGSTSWSATGTGSVQGGTLVQATNGVTTVTGSW